MVSAISNPTEAALGTGAGTDGVLGTKGLEGGREAGAAFGQCCSTGE